MQEKKVVRRRADLEYLRHGHLDYLNLASVIGPNTNGKEWQDRRSAMKQEVFVLNGKLAGEKSFLVQTLTAEIMLHNVRVVAHNHYRQGRLLEIPPRLLVLCEKAWRYMTSPMLRSKFIATLDNPVVRVSMVIPVETRRVFAAIGELDKTVNFPKKLFGGVEIMKVPLGAQYGGRRLRDAGEEDEVFQHEDIDFPGDHSDKGIAREEGRTAIWLIRAGTRQLLAIRLRSC